MKNIKPVIFAIMAVCLIWWIRPEVPNVALVLALQQQAQENERLRMWNARRERRLHWMNEPKNINAEAVATASHVMFSRRRSFFSPSRLSCSACNQSAAPRTFSDR